MDVWRVLMIILACCTGDRISTIASITTTHRASMQMGRPIREAWFGRRHDRRPTAGTFPRHPCRQPPRLIPSHPITTTRRTGIQNGQSNQEALFATLLSSQTSRRCILPPRSDASSLANHHDHQHHNHAPDS